MTEPPNDSIGMEHEDRDTRLRRVITQCYTRRWITESPTGGILGLPTTIIMIAAGVLFSMAGIIAITRGSTILGCILVGVSMPVCVLEIIWRSGMIRATRMASHRNQLDDRAQPVSGLDIGMIMNPWVSFAMRAIYAIFGSYMLISATIVAQKPMQLGVSATTLLWVLILSDAGSKSWRFRRSITRVHSGRCIFCEFAVQPDLATPVPLDAAYSSARCSDCGHFVPIVVPADSPPKSPQP